MAYEDFFKGLTPKEEKDTDKYGEFINTIKKENDEYLKTGVFSDFISGLKSDIAKAPNDIVAGVAGTVAGLVDQAAQIAKLAYPGGSEWIEENIQKPVGTFTAGTRILSDEYGMKQSVGKIALGAGAKMAIDIPVKYSWAGPLFAAVMGFEEALAAGDTHKASNYADSIMADTGTVLPDDPRSKIEKMKDMLKGGGKGVLSGLLLQGLGKATSFLPKIIQPAAEAAGMYVLSAAEGGTTEENIAQGMLGYGMKVSGARDLLAKQKLAETARKNYVEITTESKLEQPGKTVSSQMPETKVEVKPGEKGGAESNDVSPEELNRVRRFGKASATESTDQGAKIDRDLAEKPAEKFVERVNTGTVDRRVNNEKRLRIEDMTNEQKTEALSKDELTGIWSGRAYQQHNKKPIQIEVDVDNLKGINRDFQDAGGNAVLKKIAYALDVASGGNAYHKHGDTFYIQADTPKIAAKIISDAKEILKNEPLTFNKDGKDVTFTPDFSHGIAGDLKTAEANAVKNKADRKVVRGGELNVTPVTAEPPTVITQTPVMGEPTTLTKQPTEVVGELPLVEQQKPSGMIGEKVQSVLNRFPVAYKNAKKAYLDWVNKAQDIDNLSKFAKENNIKLDETLDPILATRRKWGAVGTANSILMDGTLKKSGGDIVRTGEGFQPIIRDFDSRSTIKDKKLRIARLDEFLQANRTVTDLASAEKATPVQIEAARKKLNALEMTNPTEYKNLKETSNRLYDYQKRVLSMLVESGVLSKESYDNILAKNKAYVPFERILPDLTDNLSVSGKLRSAPLKVIFGMKGSEKEVKNTIESIVKKTYQITDAAETNNVNRSVAQFADVLPELIKKQKYYPGRKPGKNEMIVYENGNPSIYKVSDGIFQGMKVLDPKSSGLLMKILTVPKKILQVGATATPDFAIRNLMRDQTGAMLNTKIKFRPFVDTISSIADIMGKKDVFKEYMASGAGMQSYADLNRNALTKTLEHIRGNRSALQKMNIISHLGDLSSLLETATRLGVYKAARKAGETSGRAGYISAESTLDFRRSGTKAENVNKVVAFFNAGMQGVDRMARAAKSDPVGFTAKAIAAVTIPEIIFQIINKDDEEFTNSPRWRKDLFWHIPGLNVWIPKPFVVGQAFGSVPGRFMEYVISKDPHAFDGIINTMAEAFSPVGIDAVGSLMPTAIKPFMENMFNYSFFTQTNLYPEYKEKLDPSERSSKFTGETFKKIGEALGMSPSKIENLFRGYTAGLGQYAAKASDALINSFNKDVGTSPTELSDIPVVKGFVGRRTSSSPEKLNRFYRAYEDVDIAYTRHNKLDDAGKDDEAERYLRNHPEIKYKTEFNRYRKEMTDYGKEIDEINKKKIPDIEKRKQLIEVERRRLKSLDEILGLFGGKVKLLEIPKTLRGILQ